MTSTQWLRAEETDTILLCPRDFVHVSVSMLWEPCTATHKSGLLFCYASSLTTLQLPPAPWSWICWIGFSDPRSTQALTTLHSFWAISASPLCRQKISYGSSCVQLVRQCIQRHVVSDNDQMSCRSCQKQKMLSTRERCTDPASDVKSKIDPCTSEVNRRPLHARWKVRREIMCLLQVIEMMM